MAAIVDVNGYRPLTSTREVVCNWLSHVKLSRIILLTLVVLVIFPLVTHYYLSKVESDSSNGDIHRTRSQLEAFEDFSAFKASDLKLRIAEMLRIKVSVSNELRDLESKRQRLLVEIAGYSQRIDELKNEMSHLQTELERLKISVEQAKVSQREAIQKNTPELALPKKLLPGLLMTEVLPNPTPEESSKCKMHLCFDYSRCSLTSGFPVYIYDPEEYAVSPSDIEEFIKTTIMQTLGYNPHLTGDPEIACVYLVLVGEVQEQGYNRSKIEDRLRNLPYWNGDGRNHILLNLARSSTNGDVFSGVNVGRAMIVQSQFFDSQFRKGFDLVIPPVLGPPGGDVWQLCAPMLPARRRFLLSFQGEYNFPHNYHTIREANLNLVNEQITTYTTQKTKSMESMIEIIQLDNFIVEHLKSIQFGSTSDKFFFQFSCSGGNKIQGLPSEWFLCDSEAIRGNILKDSTFSLIIAPSNFSIISTTLLQVRLYESLRHGAVPVFLGDHIELPFSEFVSWKKAALFLPKPRITELHFFLRTVPDNDLLAMRRQGRLIWEHYFGSMQSVIDTIVAVFRERLGIPPLPIDDEPSPSIFNASFVPLKTDVVVPEAEPDESLGPLEPPYPSPKFKRNFTYFLTQGHEMWNEWGDPFHLYPQLPFDILLPSDSKFIGSGFGFRPIGKGAGGAGKEFSESLGGNSPREQFTIVMLTYEREQVLINSLSRLYGLPYLNKVVVVWNSPKPPLEDLRWPEIGVPIHVVKASHNSLNNRFLPYDVIETEAILSVDDDAHLRPDEIMFGFRVWREQRDRIVGFPGRYHAWDLKYDGWLYNSNYSCELSMVLTGAAFFHKYYAYLYSYWMPQAIRDKVDFYMNCEDIAMNFLVSHLTRKPPVKVTSRWTFRCPGCPVSLSEDDTHFQERHKCINFFTKVFGYNPLLNTQFRADSILFKTRIPHDKQKCFKFI